MRLLIDTDVLIDLALDREPFSEPAAALLDVLEAGRATGWIAWHSASNFFYLVAPVHGPSRTRRFLAELTAFAAVAETTTESLRLAATLDLKDFEDAMQVAAAIACRADWVVTRNLKDYRSSPVPASTPQAILRELS